MAGHPFLFSNSLYATLAAALPDWVAATTLADLETANYLTYINRAQVKLETTRIWPHLLQTSELTISDSDNTATCPSDMRIPYKLLADSDNDNILDYPYIIGKNKDVELTTAFVKATGSTVSLLFHVRTNRILYEPVYLIYQKGLDAFSGTDDEYMYFPYELMDTQVKLLILRDCGETGAELKSWENNLINEINDYAAKSKILFGQSFMNVCDINGRPIAVTHEAII